MTLSETRHAHDPFVLRDRYLAAQLAGNRRAALEVIVDEGLERGLSPLDAQKVVQEAQREIGRLWQEDRISIAEEHMATAISQLALSHIYQRAEPLPSIGKKVIVACVEGELHDFPSRLVADALDLAGFEVRFLGASVPTPSLLRSIEQEEPDLLVLSVTMSFNVGALREATARVREVTRGTLPIAMGGGACSFAAGIARELHPDVTGLDATELVRNARAFLKVDA